MEPYIRQIFAAFVSLYWTLIVNPSLDQKQKSMKYVHTIEVKKFFSLPLLY